MTILWGLINSCRIQPLFELICHIPFLIIYSMIQWATTLNCKMRLTADLMTAKEMRRLKPAWLTYKAFLLPLYLDEFAVAVLSIPPVFSVAMAFLGASLYTAITRTQLTISELFVSNKQTNKQTTKTKTLDFSRFYLNMKRQETNSELFSNSLATQLGVEAVIAQWRHGFPEAFDQ